MRGNAEQVTQVGGVTPSAVHLGGGMTRSEALLRVIAETLGRSIVVSSVTETASLGSAMLAAVGLGWCGSLDAAVQSMAQLRHVDPDPSRFDAQDARYAQWREGFAAIGGLSV